MTKRYAQQLNSFKYKGEAVKVTMGTLMLTLLCVILLIIATFTQITLKHPYIPFDALSFLSQDHLDYEIVHHFMKVYKYIPQIPMLFFIVTFLGRKFGLLTIIIYIILGMFFPLFALGGGFSYLFEYGFGYILAYIPAVFLAGTLLKNKKGFLTFLIVSTLGVLIIHLLGVFYMLFIATLRHASSDLVTSWIASQSGIQIFYDICFSTLAIYFGKFVRKFLWIIMC